ncbi:NAD(P)-dependent dehydrogenase, short-chain alcohol dehydrogenase family [Burkholderia sp. GAS332]|nr:NAD(P)-dependent dehydrogenase, short-chain alcohol dehydrogenase family [Burkholderia sp. GAS332]
MIGRVSGKVALVTGAAKGLGLAIAARLREEGARVLMTDVDPAGQAKAEAIGATFAIQDVSSEESWIDLKAQVEKTFGSLHILVNNAGIEGRSGAPRDPEGTSLADWNAIFAVNTAGTFLGCKYMIRLIGSSGGGSIVNLSSVAALVPTPFLTAYGASKAAVCQFTTSVALHCARSGTRIRCNSVHPGQVRTPMLSALFSTMAAEQGLPVEQLIDGFVAANIPLGSLQDPVDIANIVLFLASDESRYITGQAIACDGGYTLVA